MKHIGCLLRDRLDTRHKLDLDEEQQDEELCNSFGYRWPGGRSWLC